MKNRIEEKLTKNFAPEFLEVKNNSQLHRGHDGNPGGSDETHFAVTIKSVELNALGRVAAHRKINQLLNDEFARGLHALEINIKK